MHVYDLCRSDDMTGQFTLAALEEEEHPATYRRVSDLEQGVSFFARVVHYCTMQWSPSHSPQTTMMIRSSRRRRLGMSVWYVCMYTHSTVYSVYCS